MNWLRNAVFQGAVLVGVSVSTYLILLKLGNVPCFGGGECNRIINSKYGTFLGLPVSMFSLILWYAVWCLPRIYARTLLVVASVFTLGFIYIQYALLQGFCYYCLLHALAVFLATIFYTDSRPKILLPLAHIVAVMISLLLLTSTQASSLADINTPTRYGEFSKVALKSEFSSPNCLVISLTCPTCLKDLEKILSTNLALPQLLFFTDEHNQTLTELILAHILTNPDRDAGVLSSLLMVIKERDQIWMLNQKKDFTQLGMLFPHEPTQLSEAKLVIAEMQQLLNKYNINYTPYVINAPTTP